MKQVNFKKVSIQNFLSIGNDPVEIEFKRGINFVAGINKDKPDRSNGCGKSSIVDSIFWCLFGEMVRGDLKNDEIINSITKKNCLVRLEFETIFNNEKNEYVIIRGLKPGKLELYKNGEQITLSSKSNTTEYISEIINSTPDMFMNCIIMSLNNTIPFMAKSKIEKRKFIEQIFNLDFFNRMLLSIRDDYNKHKTECDIVKAYVDSYQKSLEQNKEEIEKYEKEIIIKKDNLKEKEQQYSQQIIKLENDIKINSNKNNSIEISKYNQQVKDNINKQKKIEKIIKDIKQAIIKNEETLEKNKTELNQLDFKTIEGKYNKLNTTISSFMKDIENIEKQINNFKKFKQGDKCPTCKNIIDGQNFENIKSIIKSLEKDKKDILNKINKLNTALEELDYKTNFYKNNEYTKKINELQYDIAVLNNSLNRENDNILSFEKNINSLNIKINELKNNDEKNSLYIDNIKKQIVLLTKHIEDIKKQYEDLNTENPFIKYEKNIKENLAKEQQKYDVLYKQLEMFNVAKFIVSEEGIKSYIIKQVIDIFNNKILYYLNKFESNCIVKFDETFDVIITNEKNDERSYFNFSGAERKGIDLACLFTFMDMRLLLHGISYNINIYDELIDTSLDEKGIELVISEIKHRVEKYNEASYIISHRKESLNYATGDVITMVKENGITRKLN